MPASFTHTSSHLFLPSRLNIPTDNGQTTYAPQTSTP